MALQTRETVIDAIKVAIEATILDGEYEGAIKSVVRFPFNTATLEKFKSPVVFIDDGEQEELVSEDATNWMLRSTIVFDIASIGRPDDVLPAIYKAEAALKKLFQGNPDISAYGIDLAVPLVDVRGASVTGTIFSASRMRSTLLSLQPKDSSTAQPATLFGENWLDEIKQAVIVVLTELKDAGAFQYLYDSHYKAGMLLNAVSVSVTEASTEMEGVTRQSLATNDVMMLPVVSIRCHTAYIGGQRDEATNQIILSSIVNKLHSNYSLQNNWHIEMVAPVTINNEFAESYTLGGEVVMAAKGFMRYTQEN